jgi:hypothetical protein
LMPPRSPRCYGRFALLTDIVYLKADLGAQDLAGSENRITC